MFGNLNKPSTTKRSELGTQMEVIAVSYEVTNNLYKAKQWLNNLPDLFAADFETASRFSAKEKAILEYRINNFKTDEDTMRMWHQQLYATPLSHPSLTTITHLSIGWSDRDSYVIVCDTDKIKNLILDFLTSTSKTQIWHNAQFDFKHIFHHTGLFPPNFIDTMLLSKCILNDANSFRDKVGLKELMGYKYGDWAISKDEFTLEEMWSPQLLRYTATDSPATYNLYQDIQDELNKWKI